MTLADQPSLPLPSPIHIGWIGTGVMGGAMCGHFLSREYGVTVHTRTRAKAEPLLARGASWADSPRAVADRADVVFTMVGFPRDVQEVYLGRNGLLESPRPGLVCVDMTTSQPGLAKEIANRAGALGVYAIDAPVSGGDIGARQATLSIMVGGEKAVVQRVRPLLDVLGTNIIWQGEAGSGQHAKLCNQMTIAGTMIGVCETLLYGQRAGLDLSTLLQAIRGGAASCWTLDHLAPRILRRDFAPGFLVEHFIKDLEMALEEAGRMRLWLPGLALAHQLYLAVRAQGHERRGTQALFMALEQLAGGEIDQAPLARLDSRS